MATHELVVLAASDLLVIADDLAGAAETAAALTGATGNSCELHLDFSGEPVSGEAVLVVDTDSRYTASLESRRRVARALDARPGAGLVVKKVDSLLRGRISHEIGALRDAGLAVIASFALPSLGRTVSGGVVFIDGVPLHETSAWSAERSAPPRSVAQALGGVPAVVVPVSTVRGEAFLEALESILAVGTVPLCDAETGSDLERIADAAVRLAEDGERIALTGAGDLARALGRRLRVGRPVPAPSPLERPVLVVAGTLADSIALQLDHLAGSGATIITVGHRDLVTVAPRIASALEKGVVALHVDPSEQWHRDDLATLAGHLAQELELSGVDLVLTGGETARRVLDAAGISTLYPEHEIAAGVVVSHTVWGSRVVTRPGSFGGADSLVEIVAYLTKEQHA